MPKHGTTTDRSRFRKRRGAMLHVNFWSTSLHARALTASPFTACNTRVLRHHDCPTMTPPSAWRRHFQQSCELHRHASHSVNASSITSQQLVSTTSANHVSTSAKQYGRRRCTGGTLTSLNVQYIFHINFHSVCFPFSSLTHKHFTFNDL